MASNHTKKPISLSPASSAALPSTLDFCHAMPKVELHAHLHGSIRDSTLQELLELNERQGRGLGKDGRPLPALELLRVGSQDERSLKECFELFDAIHHVVTSPEVVTRVTEEVISDFAAENVCYLELRTTPRADHAFRSRRAYLAAVIRGIEAACGGGGGRGGGERGLPIVVRLLLSVNRVASLEVAMETCELAAEFARPENGGWVVGVDFSGNPHVNNFQDFLPAFALARRKGLGVTVHTAEITNPEETAAIFGFRPDRLGHVLRLGEADKAWLAASLAASKREQQGQQGQQEPTAPPIEICPTSNMRTLALSALVDHPTLGTWLKVGFPFTICTDDSGVFATSLSQEFDLVAKAFGLTTEEVLRLSRGAADHIFERDPHVVAQVRRRFDDFGARAGLLSTGKARL